MDAVPGLTGEGAGPIDRPPSVVREAVVAGVRRRHTRRHQLVVGLGLGLAVAAALGYGLSGSGTPTTTSAGPASGHPRPTAGPASSCVEIAVGRERSLCGGVTTTTGRFAAAGPSMGSPTGPTAGTAGGSGTTGASGGAATGSPEPAAAPLRLKAGQAATVRFPAGHHWARPSVVSAAAVKAAAGATAGRPVVHIRGTGRPVSVVAGRPGTVTVAASGSCAGEPASCRPVVWFVDVEVR